MSTDADLNTEENTEETQAGDPEPPVPPPGPYIPPPEIIAAALQALWNWLRQMSAEVLGPEPAPPPPPPPPGEYPRSAPAVPTLRVEVDVTFRIRP